MRVLVTGANGQMAQEVCKRLKDIGITYKGIDIQDCDITNKNDVFNTINEYLPDCVIHCAAYTAVDKAETNIEICMSINRDGSEHVAKACKQINAKMVYLSTDYVFEGIGDTEHEIDSPKNPLSIYGKSKLAGEEVVKINCEKYFIVRLSWLFSATGNNFVKTMIKKGKENESLKVVCDQIGSPTYAKDLAILLCDIIQTEKYGVYHATNEGFCSWSDFAKAIMEKAQINCRIIPIKTKDYMFSTAQRPLNSRLSKSSLNKNGFNRLPSWESALDRCIAEIELCN